MLLRSVFSLMLLLALFGMPCYAQGPAAEVLEDDDEVMDVFAVGDTIVAYLYSDLPSEDNAMTSVKRIIPVDRAAQSGRLRAHARALVDFSLGSPHKSELFELSAKRFDNAGFVWNVKWYLWPATGGFSGVPYQYKTYLRANGKPIEPHFYLTDFVPLNKSGDLVYSALSFDDADPGKETGPTPEIDARSLATAAINVFVADHQKEDREFSLNYHKQTLVDLPVGADDNQNLITRKVWEIEFSAKLAIDEVIPNNTLTVWVSADGIVSKLTLNEWKRENQRTSR